MKLESVNVGQPEPVNPQKPEELSGIFKRPVEGPVAIGGSGIASDAVIDQRYHGGVDQALYLYSIDDYAYWEGEGVRTQPGLFGENLTVSGLESGSLCIGDRLEIGGVTLEVSASRIPCANFAARMGDPQFVKRFRDAERPGAYLRVITQGTLAAGQAMTLMPYNGDRLSLAQHFRDTFRAMKQPLNRTEVERLLALPIAERDRQDQLEHLAAMGG